MELLQSRSNKTTSAKYQKGMGAGAAENEARLSRRHDAIDLESIEREREIIQEIREAIEELRNTRLIYPVRQVELHSQMDDLIHELQRGINGRVNVDTSGTLLRAGRLMGEFHRRYEAEQEERARRRRRMVTSESQINAKRTRRHDRDDHRDLA